MISNPNIEKRANLWIRYILERIELLIGWFFIFKIRSIRSDKILSRYSSYPEVAEEVAIVMQGPVIKKAGFTYETLKLYRKIYPNIIIILSTWTDSDESVLEKISELNIQVIRSELPSFSGDSNINYQLKSTIEGFNNLNQDRVKYVLKTRSDQRIYSASDYIQFMIRTLEAFPVRSERLQKRLIVSNLNMFRNRKYNISDMFMFGTLADMRLYWDIPFQNEILIEDKSMEFFENKLAEAHLVHYFFRNIGFIPRKTHEDSNRFLNSYFYVIDKNVIDLFWYKYNHSYERSLVIVDDKEDRNYSTIDWGNS
jgi:hypothetical protein